MNARRLITLLASTALLALALVACGDDSDDGGASANNSAANNSTANNASTNNASTNNASTNNASTNNATNNNTPTNNATNNNTPTNNATNNNSPANNNPPANFTEEGRDLADCISDCLNASNPGSINLNNQTILGVRGVLDAEDHVLNVNGENVIYGDLDVYELKAPPRRVVDLILRKPAGSLADPVMTLSDGLGAIAFAYIDDGAAEIRHRFVYPYVNDLPLFVLVEDAVNFNNYPDGPYVGGDDYTYELTWETSDFAPVELGVLASGGTLTHSDAIDTRGEMHFYRFTSAEGVTPQLTVNVNGNADFSVVAAPLNAFGGQAVYTNYGCEDGGVNAVRTWQGVGRFTEEHLFAVWECNSNARADFNYTVTITAP